MSSVTSRIIGGSVWFVSAQEEDRIVIGHYTRSMLANTLGIHRVDLMQVVGSLTAPRASSGCTHPDIRHYCCTSRVIGLTVVSTHEVQLIVRGSHQNR